MVTLARLTVLALGARLGASRGAIRKGGSEREDIRNTSLKGRALEREAQGSERERRERTEFPVHGKLHHTYRERENTSNAPDMDAARRPY